jgi:hypothetical protein
MQAAHQAVELGRQVPVNELVIKLAKLWVLRIHLQD